MEANTQTRSNHSRIVVLVERMLQKRPNSRPVSADDVLMEVGLTSLDLVKLVFLVELEFDLTFPTSEITPGNFRSIAAIDQLVTRSLHSA